MNATQKRIVLILAAVTSLVFVAALIAWLAPSDDEPPAAGATTTTTAVATAPTDTSQPTTTTSAPTTTAPADTTTSSSTSTSTSTSTTTTSTSTTTTTSTTAPATLELRGNGLESVPFGTEAEIATQALTDLLGAPDEDSGWIPSFSGFGTCPGDQVRGLRWATMWVLMTDGSTEWRDDGVPHFFSYLNSVFYDTQSLGLATEAGIALGDRVDALRQAYGDDLAISFDDFADGFIYTITVPAPGRLGGGLTGDQDDDRITSIDGGTGCGE